jgi:hypothetical protein
VVPKPPPIQKEEDTRTNGGQPGDILGAVGRSLATQLGGVPQDVEGALARDGKLWVVQSRPQPI